MNALGFGGAKPLNAPKPKIVVDFEKGDTVVVIAGAWEDTTGVVTAVNAQKQTVTINVELFGRETPVEISFADVKLNN
jgi:transcriptional antiterminator NusG